MENSAQQEPPAGGNGAVILVVDDEPTVRALVRRVLERAGYRVLVAVDGPEALTISMAHEGEIDVLLTDVVMPGLGGTELRDALHVARPGMRVIFMSGFTPDMALRHEVGSAAGRFLSKPFTSAQLLTAVAEALAARGETS